MVQTKVKGKEGLNQITVGNWSVNKGNPMLGRLTRAIEDARSGSNWPPGGASQLGSAMRVYGYNDLRFDEYNRKNDWP